MIVEVPQLQFVDSVVGGLVVLQRAGVHDPESAEVRRGVPIEQGG